MVSTLPFRWTAFVISFLLAIVLELIMLQEQVLYLRPEWLTLAVMYWLLRHPEKFGLAFGFSTGLLMDLMSGSYFGIHALALSVVSYLILGMHKRLKMYPLPQQAMVAFLVSGIQLMFVYTLRSFLSYTDNGLEYLWQAAMSALFWPFVVVLYDRLAYTFR